MAEHFEAAELVKIAIEDEKSGVAYYSMLAGKAADEGLRGTFANLAQQEMYHQRRFEKLLADLGGYTREEYPGEYMAYLRALTDGRAFPDVYAAQQAAQQCSDDLSALDTALRFERDTLVLMSELRDLLPQRDQKIVEDLLNEERSHLVVLTAQREKLT